MTIERIKLPNGEIGVYRRCKKTLKTKIPNIDHLTQYERYWFLQHFYSDFANNTNGAYPKTPIFNREDLTNATLLFTTIVFIYNLVIDNNVNYAIYGLITGLILMLLVIFVPIPSLRDPRDTFFKLNDVPDWKEYLLEYKETNQMLTEEQVAIRALQITQEEYRYLKAIDSLDGRWYEGLIEINSLKKAIQYSMQYAKATKITSTSTKSKDKDKDKEQIIHSKFIHE